MDFFPVKSRLTLYGHRIKYFKEVMKAKKMLDNEIEHFKIDDASRDKLYRSLVTYITYKPKSSLEYISAFFKSDITKVKDGKVKLNEVITIVPVKDDLVKIKEFIKYHNRIGLTNFVFIDNNSSDGTFEYLISLENVEVFRVTEMFSSVKCQAWFNRVILDYGYDKWYLCLDSDEFFSSKYDFCDIHKLVEFLESRKQYRFRTMLLDMYASNEWYKNGNPQDFMKECIYYDYKGYSIYKTYQGYDVLGGVRKRIFDINPTLTKYPLFKFQDGDVFLQHLPLIYEKNDIASLDGVILHYKFLPNDIIKYEQYALSEIHANNSYEYKKYVDKMNTNFIGFYDENSSAKFIRADEAIRLIEKGIRKKEKNND
ncbi:glycosyltransferase family 2 protein [Enterococcus pallens]|uniref:Uncharacterized protein n=1 Tax=Enterococcus pallens ATCC BAA-351 TaxID=1158607 RepID=R2T3W2_9ENTE|nr:glycosyltransferase family 2 protein [Enterococcus pallens]EOH94904.1 hypothetical protein UAU_01826 [Enterococcus pallens ATCC BAA-351]EOU14777.1 hypothetical protein I588_04427 [Enterococcus pallens ATCC BAA-351]OJG77188.1 hypothetical protein RV10_GL002927 [Enterococcus pallens]